MFFFLAQTWYKKLNWFPKQQLKCFTRHDGLIWSDPPPCGLIYLPTKRQIYPWSSSAGRQEKAHPTWAPRNSRRAACSLVISGSDLWFVYHHRDGLPVCFLFFFQRMPSLMINGLVTGWVGFETLGETTIEIGLVELIGRETKMRFGEMFFFYKVFSDQKSNCLLVVRH